MNTSRAWLIESTLLDIYSLLVHRIEGLGWSLCDFWKADTWTTSKLYLMELDLIDEEEKANGKSRPEDENSEEAEDMMGEMFGYED